MKYELSKTIEAVKLNPRTMRPLSPEKSTIPFGGIIEKITEDRDKLKFFHDGNPYECPESDLRPALRELK